jgi:multidrug efflux pump subunit AcrA (membrane-fusion protein)
MNWILFLIILGMAGGGYYEYQNLQHDIANDDQRLADVQAKLDAVSAENKKGQADKDAQVAAAQQAIKAVQAQLDDAQKQLASAKAAVASAAAAPAPVAVTPKASPSGISTKLGTIATLDGKSYEDCKLLKVNPDGIVVNHSQGITKILFNALPPDMQKIFGFDPHAGPDLTPEQVLADESKRQVADSAGN